METQAESRLPAIDIARVCVFLDFDGTLVDHIDDPMAVRVDDQLRTVLARLQQQTGGALAIISGRPIADIDRILAPLRLPVAGIHGFERRTADGLLMRRSEDVELLGGAREQLRETVRSMPGLRLEDKQVALALHYRATPQWQTAAHAAARDALQGLEDHFELLEGAQVIEIKPAQHNKASAIEAYLQEAPFAGRIPVFLGNDTTDLDGFAAVQRHGGMAISVGELVQTQWRLPTSNAAQQWLQQLTTNAPPT